MNWLYKLCLKGSIQILIFVLFLISQQYADNQDIAEFVQAHNRSF